jgi:hypothetical protein
VCKDASQGFYYSEVLQSQKIFSSLSAVRTKCHLVRTPICPLFHPSGRRVHPDRTPDRPASSVRTTYLFHSDPTLYREASIQLASVRTSQQPVWTPISTRTVSDSFQVPIKGRSINRPVDVVSCLDARLLKARIAIQISWSGRQSALVRTCVQLRRKLPIRLQPSGRLPLMVRTHA